MDLLTLTLGMTLRQITKISLCAVTFPKANSSYKTTEIHLCHKCAILNWYMLSSHIQNLAYIQTTKTSAVMSLDWAKSTNTNAWDSFVWSNPVLCLSILEQRLTKLTDYDNYLFKGDFFTINSFIKFSLLLHNWVRKCSSKNHWSLL